MAFESLTDKLQNVFKNLKSKGRLTEEDVKVLATCTLEKPEDAADQWGSLYLNPDSADPGIYDIVFVKDGKAVAVMEAKFYAEVDPIRDKSDDDLRAMMKNF